MKTVRFGKLRDQKYTMKESLRALKTNIQFCGDDIRTIVITSALPNEGKSTVTLDLARSLTESGKRVLLIDTDMRKSVYVGRLRATATDEVKSMVFHISSQVRRNWRMCIRNRDSGYVYDFCRSIGSKSDGDPGKAIF